MESQNLSILKQFAGSISVSVSRVIVILCCLLNILGSEGAIKMKRFLVLSITLAIMGVLSVYADTIAYTDPAGQGNQSYGGNLALNFDVVSPITVTSLGAFNASGSGTITGTIQVVIFNTVTRTEVTPVETFHGAYAPEGLGFDVFQTITPVVLGAGTYEVDAVGFSGVDLNGNINYSGTGPVLNSGGGKLLFTGASYDGNGSLDDPASCPGCQPAPAQLSQFDAGTVSSAGGPPPYQSRRPFFSRLPSSLA